MKTMTKQLLNGKTVEITVRNGTASATIDGVSTGCTSGIVQRVKPFGPSLEFVGGICKVALTSAEVDQVEQMLSEREPVEVAEGSVGGGVFHQSFTAQVDRAGNINKFAKGGVL